MTCIVRRLYLPLWAFFSVWPLSAAASTFANGVQGYDWESLTYAVGTALVGAAFKTAFTLSSTRVAVLSVLRELWRDGIAAAIAGVVMYLVIGAWGVVFTPPHFLLAMPLLFAAGWARGAFLTWTEGRAKDLADATVDSVGERIRNTIGKTPDQRRREDQYGRWAGGYAPDVTDGNTERDAARGNGRFTRKDASHD